MSVTEEMFEGEDVGVEEREEKPDELVQLRARVAELEAELKRPKRQQKRRPKERQPEPQIEYVEGAVEHGSDRHAELLGLRKATEEDDLQREGWTLADLTMYGPNVTEMFLRNTLWQKVNELNTLPSVVQSEDPFAPNYAPPLWTPERELAQRSRSGV